MVCLELDIFFNALKNLAISNSSIYVPKTMVKASFSQFLQWAFGRHLEAAKGSG